MKRFMTKRYYPENWPENYLNDKFVINIFEEDYYYENLQLSNDEEFATNRFDESNKMRNKYFVSEKIIMNIIERIHLTSDYNINNVGAK